jgi:signal transduction histidine kinase/CheY-like chemotaxis protein
MGWTAGMLREGMLPPDSAVIGPVIAVADTLPGFVTVAPVRGGDGVLLGYVEEVHTARGAGVAQIRALLEVERLLLGSRDWTVWTNLESIVAGPEFTAPQDSLQRVTAEDGRVALGLAREVPGTRWMVWVERHEAPVLAPMEAFLRRMWFATLLIAVTGALLAWLLARYLSSRILHVATELDRTLSAHGAPAAVPGGDRDAKDELRQLERAYAALEARVEQRRQLDEQVLQAQKLEAVGRLAGGIAHDFNNLLTVMASYAAMAREGLPADSPEAKDIDEVLKAVDRATALTRQLLAFSRQHLTDAHPLNLNEVVRSTESMLARLIPSNVEREVRLADALPSIVADHTQLEQVLINLVVNAVDAMPEGGRLTLQTSIERRAGLGTHAVPLAAEDCVCLTIGDTGVGMDAATIARVFDPFFTTKPLGKGTGLGLATVHGIVESLGGRIEVTSVPGKGTQMRVLLPAVADAALGPVQGRHPLAITAEQLASGLVLVAEDDPSTRAVICRILEAGGHRVEAHETADAALASLRARGTASLPLAVITDVMMPGLNGIAFTALLRDEFPSLPVILVSGYADVRDRVPDDLAARPVILEKPFTARALHDALRRAVASASGRQA